MIKVYSTFSKDIILDKNRNCTDIRKGGPAFYIEKVLKKHKVEYKMYSGKTIDVEIVLINKEEIGEIKSKIKKNRKIENINNNDFIMISTIGDEWILGNDISSEIKIFLDIQGYIRSKYELGKSINKIFCAKGTKEEINKLPLKVKENQKKKCLIITEGKNGTTIYFKNKKHVFHPREIKVNNTIGAGDIFFASFIVKFIGTNNIIKSGNFATKETENFLITKRTNKKYE
jgi:hypothetical protein